MREVPSGFYELEGHCPQGDGVCRFAVAKDRLLKHYQETGNAAKFHEGLLLPGVLASPTGIWSGLKRAGYEDAFCIVGKPKSRHFRNEGIEIPCPPHMVFAIFVGGTPMPSGHFKILDWAWVDEDPTTPGFPVDHDGRFGRRIWPLN